MAPQSSAQLSSLCRWLADAVGTVHALLRVAAAQLLPRLTASGGLSEGGGEGGGLLGVEGLLTALQLVVEVFLFF